MIKEVINYIKDRDFKIIYANNSVDIINYDNLLEIREDVVTIKKDNKLIIVRGKDLKLSKLLDDEILIMGIIQKIEL